MRRALPQSCLRGPSPWSCVFLKSLRAVLMGPGLGSTPRVHSYSRRGEEISEGAKVEGKSHFTNTECQLCAGWSYYEKGNR